MGIAIAIANAIGYQGGAGGEVGTFDYLVNDTFTTDRSAGAVFGTDAEPGPGVRQGNDSNSVLSLASGTAIIAGGGATNGDPGLYYGPIARTAGRIMTATVQVNASTATIGWDDNTGTRVLDCIRMLGSITRLDIRTNDNAVSVGSFALNTDYQVVIILRDSGAFYLIKGGAFADWTLLYVADGSIDNLMYAAFSVESSATEAQAHVIKVPALRWLPTPLVSDGFSASTSDGLGHAEGIAGGIGSGGDGGEWADFRGTWGVGGGVKQPQTLSSGLAISVIDPGAVDALVSVDIASGGGVTFGLLLRWVDINNHIAFFHNGSSINCVKVVGGVGTSVLSVANTFVAGATMTAIMAGSKFRLYYNNVAIGSELTISDVALSTATEVALVAANLANSFDNFVTYARGTDGEYDAVLDAI